MLETSYCTDRANVVKVAAIRATSGRQFPPKIEPYQGDCALSPYAPSRRKRALDTRGLLPSGYTARDLVRNVLVPSRRLLLSYRVSTRHSRQTSDTNRLFGRNKSPRQICPTCSIVPMLPAIRCLRAPLSWKSSEGVKGVPAFRGLRHSTKESYWVQNCPKGASLCFRRKQTEGD